MVTEPRKDDRMMNPKRIIRVGLIKAVPVPWDLAANWRTFERLAREAVRQKARLICTPECFLDGYAGPRRGEVWKPGQRQKISQSLDGIYLRKARSFARTHGVFLIFGFTQRASGGCYNSAALMDDRGALLGCYHKTHLLDHDLLRYLPGKKLPVWNTALGRLGILICADRRWPEAARTLRVRGAELILNPSYGMCHLENEWWMRTRSYENECPLCFVHPRMAFVAGAGGELEAKLQSNVPAVLVHDIDLTVARNEMFAARRPEIYRV